MNQNRSRPLRRGAYVFIGFLLAGLAVVIAFSWPAQLRTYRVLTHLSVPGNGPLVFDPVSRLIYAASADQADVSILDGEKVIGHLASPGTYGVWTVPDRVGRVYVAHGMPDNFTDPFTILTVISKTEVVDSLQVHGGDLRGMAIESPSGQLIVVSTDRQEPYTTRVYEITEQGIRERLNLGPKVITQVVANARSGLVYLADGNGEVGIVRADRYEVVLDPLQVTGYHDQPIGLVASGTTDSVCLLTYSGLYLLRSDTFVQYSSFGSNAGALAALIHPNGDVYVSFGNQVEPGEVRVYRDGRENKNVTTGVYPHSMAVDSETGAVFVANAYSDDVTIIGNLMVQQTIDVGAYPYWIAYNDATQLLYTSNDNAQTITVIGPSSDLFLPQLGR